MNLNAKEQMREIKFRAWTDSGQGILIMINMEDFNPKYFYDMIINPKKHEIIWMQFTGLKDKNGKEIFEGDILKTIICKSFGKNDVWYFLTFLVEIEQDYNYGYKFNWKKIKEEKILTKTKEDYKKFGEDYKKFGQGEVIIGNIYENPELLEEK